MLKSGRKEGKVGNKRPGGNPWEVFQVENNVKEKVKLGGFGGPFWGSKGPGLINLRNSTKCGEKARSQYALSLVWERRLLRRFAVH